MSDERSLFDEELDRVQELLAALTAISDPAAKSAARELVQVVISLHRSGLSELLDIVAEAGTQPADSLVPKFAANPRVCGLLLLHDLHPEDLPTRARKAVERLRPHLGVRGVRADLVGVADDVIRVTVSATGQTNKRPPTDALRKEIEEAVMAMTPDAADLIIDGLDDTGSARDAYVDVSAIAGRRNERATAESR